MAPASAKTLHDTPHQRVAATWASAKTRLAQWRAAGETIVFTNGCFDLLHVGHITYLAEARALGDRLVVGLNSDASVRRLKGETRPLQTAEDRALLLAALRSVDAVVAFEQDTPLDLIQQLQPDVLVKGGDYNIDSIVGAAETLARGGRVEVLSFVAGKSTTSLVTRMER